jgi:membrane protein implicated in regulation of membrane protease activity
MPLGLPGILRAKKFLTAPPIYLAVLGLILVFVGVLFNFPDLITFGVLFTILGFLLSFLWKIIGNCMRDKQNKQVDP